MIALAADWLLWRTLGMRTGDAAVSCLLGLAGTVAVHAAGLNGAVTPAGLPSLPDAHGFAGCFAGVVGDTLLVAGGANFPDGVMPWNGGKKVWHDAVFSLDLKSPGGEWKQVGVLPKANAYGTSIVTKDGLILIGGGDAERHSSDVLMVRISGDRVVFTKLPSLPAPRANSCGWIWKQRIHVIGGTEQPDSTTASSSHFVLDLTDPARGWREEEALPGNGVMLATAAASDDGFWVFGGCSLHSGENGKPVRTYVKSCWRFDGQHWQARADLPRAAVGVASPAWVVDGGILLVGGDDGLQAGVNPDAHKGFCNSILVYDIAGNSWVSRDGLNIPVPVTLPSAQHDGSYILVSGEVRPGVRTPAVTRLVRKP